MANEWINFGPKCYNCDVHQADIKKLKAEIDVLKGKLKAAPKNIPYQKRKNKDSSACKFSGSQRFMCLRCGGHGDKSLPECVPDLNNVF